MLRRLFSLMSAVSFMLLIECAVLWTYSYRTASAYPFWTGTGYWRIASDKGRLWIDNEPQRDLDRKPYNTLGRLRSEARASQLVHSRKSWILHNQWESRPNHLNEIDDTIQQSAIENLKAGNAQDRYFRLMELAEVWNARGIAPIAPPVSHAVHYAKIACATCVLPFVWTAWIVLVIYRRATQVAENICTTCGYDLRATPDRCPECGNAPAKKSVPHSGHCSGVALTSYPQRGQ
ncbi:MAG TPA: hypothetical protein VFC78_12305 [Tepidisphaeraceae bacterium]|nr:hypothetical protein [Tepidisphaeraceae bacterium]